MARGLPFSQSTSGSHIEDLLAEIVVQEGEAIDVALRRFKRRVQAEDIIKEIKRHSFYVKPGDKLRAKRAAARKRARKRRRRTPRPT